MVEMQVCILVNYQNVFTLLAQDAGVPEIDIHKKFQHIRSRPKR